MEKRHRLGFTNFLNSLAYCQTSEEIEFDLEYLYNVTNLSGIGNLKNLKISKFYMKLYYAALSSISSLADLNIGENEECMGYIKELNIDARKSSSNSEISVLPNIANVNIDILKLNYFAFNDISGLDGNSYITELNLNNNKIKNLKPIRNMAQLKKLSLSSNNLYNEYVDENTNERVNNLDTLYKLNKSITSTNNLVWVNVSSNHWNNQIEEYTKVKNSFGSDSVW